MQGGKSEEIDKGRGWLLYLPALENQLLLLATAASATRATEMRALMSLMAWLDGEPLWRLLG